MAICGAIVIGSWVGARAMGGVGTNPLLLLATLMGKFINGWHGSSSGGSHSTGRLESLAKTCFCCMLFCCFGCLEGRKLPKYHTGLYKPIWGPSGFTKYQNVDFR